VIGIPVTGKAIQLICDRTATGQGGLIVRTTWGTKSLTIPAIVAHPPPPPPPPPPSGLVGTWKGTYTYVSEVEPERMHPFDKTYVFSQEPKDGRVEMREWTEDPTGKEHFSPVNHILEFTDRTLLYKGPTTEHEIIVGETTMEGTVWRLKNGTRDHPLGRLNLSKVK